MAKTHEGIIPIGFPFEVQTSKPIDDRNVVDTFTELTKQMLKDFGYIL